MTALLDGNVLIAVTLSDHTHRQVLEQVTGHTAVTDAYLASLARNHGGRVATLDRRFAALYPDVVEAISPA